MLKKTINYVDFNGVERTEDVYFNLNEVETVRLDASLPQGLEGFVENIDPVGKRQEIMDLFEKLILTSYGERSQDGRHFLKGEERMELFKQSAAYSALFTEIVQDSEKAAEFFNALLTPTAIVVENGNKPLPKPQPAGDGN